MEWPTAADNLGRRTGQTRRGTIIYTLLICPQQGKADGYHSQKMQRPHLPACEKKKARKSAWHTGHMEFAIRPRRGHGTSKGANRRQEASFPGGRKAENDFAPDNTPGRDGHELPAGLPHRYRDIAWARIA
jgi:hypothetical protein